MGITAKQGRIVEAMGAISRLRKMAKGADALALFRLRNALQEHVDFQAEEERKLIDEYGGTILENGMVRIKDADKRARFNEEYRKLLNLEVEIKADPVTINVSKLPEITLEDIEHLNGIVNFK